MKNERFAIFDTQYILKKVRRARRLLMPTIKVLNRSVNIKGSQSNRFSMLIKGGCDCYSCGAKGMFFCSRKKDRNQSCV